MTMAPVAKPSAQVIGALVAAKLALHLPILERHGWHRDELYFVACGRHLDWGYVDHAPFVPWMARLTTALAGDELWALRAPTVAAGALAVALTALLAARLGGGAAAQGLAGLCVIAAPAFLRMGKILCIPVFEPVIWTASALVLVRMLRTGEARWWLALGGLAGLGLLVKHTTLLWGAGVAVGVLLTPLRAHLRTPWPWAGAALAGGVFSPNLAWQVEHGWPTLEFFRAMTRGTLADVSRPLFLAGQLLYMNPISVVVWGAGLGFFFGSRGRDFRVLGWLFVTALAALLVTGGKPYYLAPAYPALFAGGAVLLEARFTVRGQRALAFALGAAAVCGVVLSLPVISLERSNRLLGSLFGSVVPPLALTHDLHDEHGWPEKAGALARAWRSIPEDEREAAVVLTGNYGQAAAVDFFGPSLGLPRASSGHMTYHLWGPALPEPQVALAHGLPRAQLEQLFGTVVEVGRTFHPLAHPRENDLPIHLCRDLRRPLHEAWPDLRWFGHGLRGGQ